MNQITSFKVDHTKLNEGIYISRVDGDITTYDLRMRKPNQPDLMSNSAMHSFEHMLATMMRNSQLEDKIIYVGPMGCQTGFYLLIRNAESLQVLLVLKDILAKILAYQGEMPGCSEEECGNYRNLNMEKAKQEAEKYLKIIEGYSDIK